MSVGVRGDLGARRTSIARPDPLDRPACRPRRSPAFSTRVDCLTCKRKEPPIRDDDGIPEHVELGAATGKTEAAATDIALEEGGHAAGAQFLLRRQIHREGGVVPGIAWIVGASLFLESRVRRPEQQFRVERLRETVAEAPEHAAWSNTDASESKCA